MNIGLLLGIVVIAALAIICILKHVNDTSGEHDKLLAEAILKASAIEPPSIEKMQQFLNQEGFDFGLEECDLLIQTKIKDIATTEDSYKEWLIHQMPFEFEKIRSEKDTSSFASISLVSSLMSYWIFSGLPLTKESVFQYFNTFNAICFFDLEDFSNDGEVLLCVIWDNLDFLKHNEPEVFKRVSEEELSFRLSTILDVLQEFYGPDSESEIINFKIHHGLDV